ncbi:MAG: hypothetical protein ACKOXF_06765 [Chitinophagaceae bacterium]
MRQLLLVFLVLFNWHNLSAQTFYLDSAHQHYLRFDSLHKKHQAIYRVREFHGCRLLSFGKTNFLPDEYHLSYIQTGSIEAIRQSWVDTVMKFDVFGDTLQYSLISKGKMVFDIHYNNNKRSRMSVIVPRRIDYEYYSDGSIEKHYKKRKLYELVVVSNQVRKSYKYSRSISQTPYYSKEDKAYYNFDLNNLESAILEVNCTALPIGDRQYKVTYNSTGYRKYENSWHIYRRYPFWKNFKLWHLRSRHRFRDRVKKVHNFSETKEEIFEERFNRRGDLVFYRKKYLINKGYGGNYESITTSLDKNVYRYESDSFKGHIILKRRSCFIVDTFFENGFVYITEGVFKNKVYRFTTYKNGKLYRSAYSKLDYFIYKRPRSMSKYGDHGTNILIADALTETIHSFNSMCDEDTFFLPNDSLLLVNYKNIRLIDQSGEKVLLDSFYYDGTILKDQSMCAMGVKGQDNRWIIPPVYDLVTPVNIGFVSGYFAAINDYAAIYTMKGKLLIPPTRGLTLKSVSFYPYYQSSLSRINFNAFVCNDLTTDSFKLIDMFNRIVHQGAGKFDFYNNSVIVIRHKGRMHFPKLDRDGEIHWFKDTTIPFSRNFVFLMDADQPLNSARFRLLNMSDGSDWQLDKDTFSVFYWSKYYAGFRSSQRQILFGSYGTYEDVNGLEIDSFYRMSDYCVLRKGKRYGLIEDGKLILKPEFDGIQIGNSVLFAYKDGQVYMYSRGGDLIRNLGSVHTFLRNDSSVVEMPMLEYVTDENDESIIEVWENGLCGILSNKGEMLLPCIYEDINLSNGQYGHVYIKEKLSIVTLSEDSVLQKWEIKDGKAVKVEDREPLIFYHTRKYQHYLAFSGKKALEVRDYIERKNLTSNYQIFYYAIYDNEKDSVAAKHPSRFSQRFRGDKLIGLRDFQLNWIIRFDTFSVVRPESRFYYIKTRQGKSGVMSKNYQMKVPPQYPFIYYDERLGLLWHADKKDGLWKIKDLRMDEELPDSFDYPVSFEPNDMSKPISKFGYYGIISSRGKVFVPMIYDKISEKTHNQSSYIMFKNNQFYTSCGSGNYVAQPYNKLLVERSNGRYRDSHTPEFALNGETVYSLQAGFCVSDSSKKFFMDKIQSVSRHWTGYTTQVHPKVSSSNEEYTRKKIVMYLIDGIGAVYYIWWHSPVTATTFPEIHPKYTYPAETVSTKSVFKGSNKGEVTAPIYTSDKLEVDDILNKNLTFFGEDFKTLTYRSDNRFLNLYFDSTGNVYKFDLSMIIAPEMKDSFSHFMRNKWLKLESPNLPCIQQEQIFDFLRTGFVMSERKFVFLPDHLQISVPRNEMLQFMTEEWARRFK